MPNLFAYSDSMYLYKQTLMVPFLARPVSTMHCRQTATTLPQLFVQNDKTPLQPLSRYAPEASTIIAKEISYFATDNISWERTMPRKEF